MLDRSKEWTETWFRKNALPKCLCDYVNFLSKRKISNDVHQMSKTNSEVHMKHLKVLHDEIKLMMN